MKFLILIFSLTLLLNADYLNTSNNHCVINLAPYPDNSGLCWSDQHDNTDYCDTTVKSSDFEDGYDYSGGLCLYRNDLAITGLTAGEWDYMLAFSANIIGFTMFFLINYLSILVARSGR